MRRRLTKWRTGLVGLAGTARTAGMVAGLVALIAPAAAQPTMSLQVYNCEAHPIFAGNFASNSNSFRSNNDALKVSLQVLQTVGLGDNFVIMPGNAGNASAFVCFDRTRNRVQRYIVYNVAFMSEIQRRTANYWANVSVLAHEIGHHANSHFIGSDSSHKSELEADYFSGNVLAKLGASLNDALAVMKTVASVEGSPSHPPRAARLDAITRGWNVSMATTRPPPAGTITSSGSGGADIRRVANTYVVGEGYRTVRNATWDSCTRACAADSGCVMIEHYRPESKCNLFGHTRTSGASSAADVGIKVQGGQAAAPAGLPSAGDVR
jgi:hypothetical protein